MWATFRRPTVLGLLALILLVVGLGGLRWCLAQQPSQREHIQATAVNPPVKYPDQPTVVLNVTGLADAIGTISQATHFANPIGNAVDRQKFLLEVCSATPQLVTWGDTFQAKYRLPLPKTTGGDNTCELWGWRFHQDAGVWYFFATTPPPVEAPR